MEVKTFHVADEDEVDAGDADDDDGRRDHHQPDQDAALQSG
jgi:hypothetical protein